MRIPVLVIVVAGGLAFGTAAAVAVTAPTTQPPGTARTPPPAQPDGSVGDMRGMHERMLRDYPEMGRLHERMLSDHPELCGMHKRMKGGS